MSTARFQIIDTIIYVGIAYIAAPKQLIQSNKTVQRNLFIGSILTILVLVGIQILILQNIGYIWVGTEGRNYFIWGLYDQEFSFKLLPNLIFMVGGVLYFAFRRYFWSDNTPQVETNISWGMIFLGIFFFNLFITITPLYPAKIIFDLGIPYFIFLFLNLLTSMGMILILQSRGAIRNGKPSKKVNQLATVSWLIFFVAIIGYVLCYLILNVRISMQVSDVFAYYPNLLFELLLTYTFYYGGLWIQSKMRSPNYSNLKGEVKYE